MSRHIENSFQRFVDTHQDLIAEYESMDYVDPLDFCKDEIIFIYKNSIKNKNVEFRDFLEIGLQNAIKNHSNIIDGLSSCISVVENQHESNITQQYFKEINKIYTKNNNDFDIKYCPENRDKLIEMNLKTVISIAKKYRGLGLTLNELISAGNLGLVTAYDKFDPSRSTLKDNALESLKNLPDEIPYQELYDALTEYIDYGNIRRKFENKFLKDHTYKKSEVEKWINSNIYNAKFNSIAVMWISKGALRIFIQYFAGILTDKYNRRNIIAITNFLSVPCALIFLMISKETVWVAYIGTFLLQSCAKSWCYGSYKSP